MNTELYMRHPVAGTTEVYISIDGNNTIVKNFATELKESRGKNNRQPINKNRKKVLP